MDVGVHVSVGVNVLVGSGATVIIYGVPVGIDVGVSLIMSMEADISILFTSAHPTNNNMDNRITTTLRMSKPP